MKKKIEQQLEYLYTMLKKYKELNGKTKYKYGFRQNAIELQIEVLEQMLDESGLDTSWNKCYEEDSKGVE